MNELLICVVGKSGSGKTTICKRLHEKYNINLCVSDTTRQQRPGETDGKDYNFISEDIFSDLLKRDKYIDSSFYYIESEKCFYKYGLNIDEVNKSKIALCITNPKGLMSLSNHELSKELNIVTILIERNDKDRLLAYLNRDEDVNVQEMLDRCFRDEFDFKELFTDYIVYNNGDIEDAVDELNYIISSEENFINLRGEC